MTLRAYLHVLFKRWRIVLAATVLGVLSAGVLSYLAVPTYTANATLFVAISASDGGSDTPSIYQSSQFAMQRVKSYPQVIDSPTVLQPVIDKLGLDLTVSDLRKMVTAENPADTVLITITATDTSATQARDIVNATGSQFGSVIERLETPRVGGQSPVKVTTTVPGQTPQSPASPRIPLNLALGLLAGLALGVVLAVLREQQDTTVKGSELEKLTGRAALALISTNPQAKTKPLITLDGQGRAVEEFRSLRTTLQFVDVDSPPRLIVVTSALAAEGKSTTACNLAIALAQSSLRVCLVEADMRRPMSSTLMGVDGSIGLSNVLAGQLDLEDALLPWHRGLLSILAAGTLPPDPTRLLASQTMATVIQTLREKFDFVIFDAPPVLPVSDAAVLARSADGAVMVAKYASTRREQLTRAFADLEAVQARIIGTIVTMVPPRGQRDLRYHNEDYAPLTPPDLDWNSAAELHAEGGAVPRVAKGDAEVAGRGSQSKDGRGAPASAQSSIAPDPSGSAFGMVRRKTSR
ncbi:polysaccharide biosynthesis tyrosine autokinase [Phycicoccus sp. Root101]|uniref:polysaccharide biosynthesis tyrosine autokinase n=1 Tax=Phycicoccus sp. Root101 TaxID=1736421 RepID=UPI0007031EE2|nr:polysaccharide biosynthesis tyrosine autokinase [Phycicoccus sp. Root101]KQU67661.1 hypothetical protein ASC58_14160 [Phycicoccus sp. Root101]